MMSNTLSNPPGSNNQQPIDIKDPRIRITFADVAMKIANDGPMYGVIILVGLLAMRGTTTAMESIVGAAFALLARSRPPEHEKIGRTLMVFPYAIGAIAAAHLIIACSR